MTVLSLRASPVTTAAAIPLLVAGATASSRLPATRRAA